MAETSAGKIRIPCKPILLFIYGLEIKSRNKQKRRNKSYYKRKERLKAEKGE